jgi:hypothetical protein
MIELIDGFPRHVVGIRVAGRVTREECRLVLAPAIAKSLRWRDSIGLYYELGSRFPGSGWDELDCELASCCARVAIVSDIAWVRLTVRAIRFLIPGEIRVFDTSAAAEARAWISARPRSQPDLDAVGSPRFAETRSRRRPRAAAHQPVSARPRTPVPTSARVAANSSTANADSYPISK